ncbi:uncharacterized protein LOC103315112 isoform X2 [Tribolium castaneum]
MFLNQNAVAQIDAESGCADSYGNLLERCIRTAIRLLVAGITKRDIICHCSSNHINSCVPIICAFFLGVPVAPVDPTLSYDEAFEILAQIRPRVIFVTPDVVDTIEMALGEINIECEIVLFGSSPDFVEFDSFLEPDEEESHFQPLEISDIRETAVIAFTKGQKDDYKGVCLSHYAIMMQCLNTISCCNFGNTFCLSNREPDKNVNGFETALSFNTFARIAEIELLCCCTFTGITKIINQKFDPTFAWRTIDKHEVSFMTCTSFQAIQLYKIGKPEGVVGTTLKMLLTQGTSLSKASLYELRKLLPYCFITNCYGLTETTGRVTMFAFTKPGDIRDQYENPTSCGKLVSGMTCKIVDPITEKILGPNQAGELRFKSDLMMNGYLKQDHSDLFDKDGWVKTGDVALYDDKHRFFVLNRLKDVFKCYSWHIAPVIIENVIKEHPAVKDAVVIGIFEDIKAWNQIPMAVVTLNRGMRNRVTGKDIQMWANSKLSKKQQLKAGVKIVKQIPITIAGEPKRQQVKDMVLCENL